MEGLKKYIKENHKSLFTMLHKIKAIVISLMVCITNFFYTLKVRLIGDDKRLRAPRVLKNRYAGRRCFIVATGPSLKIEDLEALKDEVTISVNSIVKILNQTDFVPTVYITQDKFFLRDNKDLINTLNSQSVFIGISDMGNRHGKPEEAITFEDVKDLNNVQYFNLNLSYNFDRWRYLGPPWKKKFSFDVEKEVFDGGNVTYSAIQFAAYMGCKNIYLVGVDNGVKNGKKIHMTDEEVDEEYIKSLNNDKRFELFQDEFIYAYQCLKKHGINLYNATRGGALEGIPRVNLDDIINE